jgi:hypothetical protein
MCTGHIGIGAQGRSTKARYHPILNITTAFGRQFKTIFKSVLLEARPLRGLNFFNPGFGEPFAFATKG